MARLNARAKRPEAAVDAAPKSPDCRGAVTDADYDDGETFYV
jgi:hypothetical protein